MKVLAINGSPRGPASNTQRLFAPLLEGVGDAGASVEELYLTDLDVRPCTGCFSCWARTPGKCVQQDDVAALHQKMLACDVLLLGFGLYIGSAPAKVQALLERMLPLAEPWLVEAGGATAHPPRHTGRTCRWAVVCNCGFPEKEQFGPLKARFAQLGVSPIVMAAGEFLQHMESAPELAEPMAALQSALKQAGRQLAQSGSISEELHAQLSRPVIDWAGVTPKQYRDFANQAFQSALDGLGEAGGGGRP